MLLRPFLKSKVPYFLLCLIAVIAYFPVASMSYALKNDIIALEYPIKFFISEAIHNHTSPFWFNTWALGFPLQSIITWSPFSPPGLLFAALSRYDLYALHVEFVFYIALAGCSVYRLLGYFNTEKNTRFLLSCAYMLSGFCCGSSQWLLYITAASFIPLCLSMLLKLLNTPGWKSALLFALSFYTMLTSTYVAFSIITVYVLLGVCMYKLWRQYRNDLLLFRKQIRFLVAAFLIILLFSVPCLITSMQVLANIQRGDPIANDLHFFQTNYLHPYGLFSLLGPLSVIRFNTAGTEGTMMNSYIGLFVVVFLPAVIYRSIQEKNIRSLLLLVAAALFLLLSFGHLTPARSLVNFLPGFSYFRNAGLIRYFFILFLILFLGASLQYGLFVQAGRSRGFIKATVLLISVLLFFLLLYNFRSIGYTGHSVKSFVSMINNKNSLALTALFQLPVLWLLYLCWLKNKRRLFSLIVVAELCFNTLICLPFFTVSGYSVATTSEILRKVQGSPVQIESPGEVATSYRSGEAVWFNINVFQKKISTQSSYWGPLLLKSFIPGNIAPGQSQVVDDSLNATVTIIKQESDHVVASIKTKQPCTVYFLQNWYPGWHAYLDQIEIPIETSSNNGMKITADKSGTLVFKYESQWLLLVAFAINILVILIVFSFAVVYLLRK